MAERLGNRAINQKVAGSIPCHEKLWELQSCSIPRRNAVCCPQILCYLSIEIDASKHLPSRVCVCGV